MKVNYHTHTFRCRHAAENEHLYVDKAIEGGFELLGFADHSPYFFDGEYYSSFRMYADQTPEYFTTLRALADEYRGKIDIHVGLETEYYPKYFDKLVSLLRENGCEYLILGQHFLDNEIERRYSGTRTSDEQILKDYVDQTSEAMATGLYTYFCHPDLCQYRGDDDVYRRHMTRLCENAAKAKMPLEINLLGLKERRPYPYRPFWEIAAEVGNDVIIGCDAHSPDVFVDYPLWDEATQFARDLGLHLVDHADITRL